MKDDNAVLEEVVVVGYGVQKKKLVTGATVQVKGEDIAKLNTTNALTAMQSSTPGVQITQLRQNFHSPKTILIFSQIVIKYKKV